MTKPITRKEFTVAQRDIKAALKLASTHDPDICGWIRDLVDRVNILERQIEVLGAKPYRIVRSSNIGHQAGIYAERVMRVRSKVK